MDVKKFLEQGDKFFLPSLTIDLVIIGYEDQKLKCLLLKLGDKWSLPGGFIGREESVEDAVARIMMERTGLKDPHLQFLEVFGDGNRQFLEEWKGFFKNAGITWKEDYWITQRFVTLTYYSLVDIARTHPKVGGFDEALDWFDFGELPKMMMDHREIALAARKRLKEDVDKDVFTYNLLPQQFTMPDLHRLHQVILGHEIDRSRFQKKMLASGYFKRLPKLKKNSPGRNPFLYELSRK